MSIPLRSQPLLQSHTENQKPKIPMDLDEIYVAVMGVTGAGKSRFISACTGQDVKVGHTLESCTTEVDDYSFVWKDKNVHLIDTPGFDDTHKSDREVLEGIASWMSTAYSQDIKLSGVLYLHRITDVRVGGTSLRNLTMFKKLCGDQFYPRVFLVTTMWDKVSRAEGDLREKELIGKSDFWGTMISGGASSERHYGTRDSAMDILREIIRNRKVDAPKVMKVQHEMVDDGLRLDQTTAGRQFEAELIKQREKHEREMKQMQEDVKLLLEMNQRKAALETERQRQLFEERITQSFDDQAKLKSSLQEIQQRQADELVKMQAQVARDRALYEEKIKALQRAESELQGMDPTSPPAKDLESRIAEGEKEAADMATNLDAEDKTFQKKMKRVFVKGRDWVKDHPNLIRAVAQNGISLLVKLAESELLSEITGVQLDLGVLSSLFTPAAPAGCNSDGGDDGGDDDAYNAGSGDGNLSDTGGVPARDASTADTCTGDPPAPDIAAPGSDFSDPSNADVPASDPDFSDPSTVNVDPLYANSGDAYPG